MIDFLWHLRGSAVLDNNITNTDALVRIRGVLEKQRKPISLAGPNGISFNSPLWTDWFGPNWLAMVVYDQGQFCIEEKSGRRVVRYDLRSLHGFVFCLFAAGAFFCFALPDGAGHAAKIAGLTFGWLYGMNLILAHLRIPRLIRRSLIP